MHPIWLIEAGVYREEADLLLAEVRRQGMTASIVPHTALKAGAGLAIDGQPVPTDGCVIGYGTFPFVRRSNSTTDGPPAPGATPQVWTVRHISPTSGSTC